MYNKPVILLINLVTLFVFRADAQNRDIDLLRQINGQRSHSSDVVMAAISNSAEPITVAIPLTELAWGYSHHNKKMVANGWVNAAGVGLNAIVTTGLKYSVHRVRPYVTYPDLQYYQNENTGSFPSGHTSFSFCTAASLSMSYPRWYVITPCYLWAASVGYSRLYLGEHYPTDVLAGAVVGTGCAWLALKGNQWLQKRKAKRHEK